MTTVSKKNKTAYMVDAEGNEVPLKYISKHDLKRDKLVSGIIAKVQKANRELAELKKSVIKDVDDYLAEVADDYNEKWQGNTSLTDFSGNSQIEVKVSKKLEFDERLNIVKQKVDNYIKSLVKNSNKDLVMLITKAFKVDNKGNVDTKQILSLKSYNIDNPEWQAAMKLIDDAVRISSSKRYFHFRVKGNEGDLETITLNFSQIEV